MHGAADVEPMAAARDGARRKTALADIAVLMVAMILLWQLGSWRLGHEVLPSPAATLRKLAAIMTDEDFPRHAWETGRAFGTALVIALVVGLYSIPKITLYPVILLLFGLGISAKIAFGVIHGIIPVAVFTMNAVRNIREVYFRAAKAMRLSGVQTAWSIVLPATVPEIVSGFRLGFALTLLGTLIGEMFASQRGLGYMLVKAMETNDVGTVMALALLLITLATIASSVLLAVDRKLHRGAAPA